MHSRQSYALRSLHEIPALSQTLADYFPQPEAALTGIHELLMNAVEHGNLEIGFALKADLFRSGLWHAEIERRLAMPCYASRQVTVELVRSRKECRLFICDQGKGFAWKEYVAKIIPHTSLNGRGLLIAMHSGFDHVTFNASGNTVVCSKVY